MNAGITAAELERHLSHAEVSQIGHLTPMLGLGGTAKLLGISPSTLDRIVCWGRVRKATLAKVRARLANHVPVYLPKRMWGLA